MANRTEPAPPALEALNCALCGCAETETRFVARDRLLGQPGEFPVVRCANCRLVFLKPRPTTAALSSYYPDAYYPLDVVPSAEARAAATDLLRKVAAWSREHGLDRPRLLDVGCGVGYFLHVAQHASMQVRGIELSESAVNYARTNYGLAVTQETLDDAAIAAESCDIVVLWHVLEHLPDPVVALRQIANILAPGGLLLAAVPNFDSFEARVFGRRWYSLDAPRHLYQFTPESLQRAVEHAGLTPQRLIQSTGTAGLVYSLMGDLTGVSLRLRHRPLSERAYHRTAAVLQPFARPICRLAATVGRGGALELYATKPN